MGKIQVLKKTLNSEGISGLFSLAYWALKTRWMHRKHGEEDKLVWDSLKDKYKGKRVFLMGNGPSLNKTPLYFLKDEYTICFNRFNIFLERLDWIPTMYMIADGLVAKDMIPEIDEMATKAKLTFVPDIAKFYRANFRKQLKPNNRINWLYLFGKKIEKLDFPYFNLGGSVAVGATKVLMHLGFSEIYYIGVDMSYQIHKNVENLVRNDIKSKNDDDPNHFDPRYFGKNRKYHQPNASVVNYIFACFDELSTFAKENDYTVYNATLGGKLESFERVDFYSLFDFTDTQKFDLLKQAINNKSRYTINSEEEFLSKPTIQTLEEISGDLDSFLVDDDSINKFLSKLIFDYLPFGPYKGKHIFLKR